MIRHISIKNYKCINQAELDIKPLTIVTGPNSTGKSTLLQAILLPEASMRESLMPNLSLEFDTIRCKYIREDSVIIKISHSASDDYESITITSDVTKTDPPFLPNLYGKRLYYLSAIRTISNIIKISPLDNQFLDMSDGLKSFSIFEIEKSIPVIDSLRKYQESYTLQSQVNYWISYISQQKTELSTEKVTDSLLILKYKANDISNITPSNIGTGVSFLAEILITCLRAKKDDTILIENPEIHLHPSAQSKLAEFFAYIVGAGIQIIVETHCEHLINRIQYSVYKQEIDHNDVSILYKKGYDTAFESISLSEGGKFESDFPEGFFDATLKELIEME